MPASVRLVASVAAGEVKPGAVLIADAGHSCLPVGEACIVLADSDDRLFVYCAEGKHYLERHIIKTYKARRYIGFSLSGGSR